MLTVTASPCLLHSMILAGFRFCLFIHIYVRVCGCIKTVPSFTANTTSGWTRTLYSNSYVYVVRSHSMSVDLVSRFTPQKIFNKSKKGKKNITTEELLSQFSETESPIGNWSQSS